MASGRVPNVMQTRIGNFGIEMTEMTTTDEMDASSQKLLQFSVQDILMMQSTQGLTSLF